MYLLRPERTRKVRPARDAHTKAFLHSSPPLSAKCERKSFHTRIEKLDLELSIRDRPRLANQLIQPGFGNRPVALFVNVNAMSSARRLSIEEHAKAHGLVPSRRSHDEIEIAGVKAVHDPAAGGVLRNGLSAHRPIAR